ncbi:hypothetical protein ACRALDRAFT_209708 [Sodiomyces alcalophilus JCM 7366]|uniref:uncharacterized protein n=1 Tax=Sodiomyces alcalophilus JCM 7366 TaxID=591952 RepID=UPI0039B5DC6B
MEELDIHSTHASFPLVRGTPHLLQNVLPMNMDLGVRRDGLPLLPPDPLEVLQLHSPWSIDLLTRAAGQSCHALVNNLPPMDGQLRTGVGRACIRGWDGSAVEAISGTRLERPSPASHTHVFFDPETIYPEDRGEHTNWNRANGHYKHTSTATFMDSDKISVKERETRRRGAINPLHLTLTLTIAIALVLNHRAGSLGWVKELTRNVYSHGSSFPPPSLALMPLHPVLHEIIFESRQTRRQAGTKSYVSRIGLRVPSNPMSYIL